MAELPRIYKIYRESYKLVEFINAIGGKLAYPTR